MVLKTKFLKRFLYVSSLLQPNHGLCFLHGVQLFKVFSNEIAGCVTSEGLINPME